jgi:aspartate aminotransferase
MPSWVSYGAQAALLGRDAAYVVTRPQQGGVPDPDRLDALAATSRRDGRPLAAVVLTLPDNPTGTMAAESTVRAVCDVAERHDLLVIADEIYRDLVHDDQTSYLSPAEVIPHRTVVTSGLSKNLALGGWRIGVARLPDGPRGAALTAEVVSIASEIWSVPPVPVQRAGAWAFTEPDCLRERIQLSRRLHGRVARAVADEFRGAGAEVPQPLGGFYLYPDFERHRDRLRRDHGVDDGPGLATALLDGPGIATLPGSAFGDVISALRLRVATSRLYGATPEQQEEALTAEDPTALPWIAAQLADMRNGLDQLMSP